MVKRKTQTFEIAVINKSNVRAEALKRFKDRDFSKATLRTKCPNSTKAKFLRRERGFSIYRVPLKKCK